jgi:hypothetical protein
MYKKGKTEASDEELPYLPYQFLLASRFYITLIFLCDCPGSTVTIRNAQGSTYNLRFGVSGVEDVWKKTVSLS